MAIKDDCLCDFWKPYGIIVVFLMYPLRKACLYDLFPEV